MKKLDIRGLLEVLQGKISKICDDSAQKQNRQANRNGQSAKFTTSQNLKKKCAFTLAELLITITVVGAIAILTLPGLINQYREKVAVIKLQKIYATLNQAYKISVNEYGLPGFWGTTRDYQNSNLNKTPTNAILIRDRLLVGAKVAVRCDNPKKITGCGYAEPTKNAEIYKSGGSLSAFAQLQDGTSISVMANSPTNSDRTFKRGTGALAKTYASIDTQITIANKRYSFAFYLTEEGIVPRGTPAETGPGLAYPFPDFGVVKGYGAGYTAWVLTYKNLDYLHCPKKLSWNGKHSCSE